MAEVSNQLDFSSLSAFWKSTNTFQFIAGKTPFSHYSLPFVASFFYLIALYIFQKIMTNRPPLTLKIFGIIHNGLLNFNSPFFLTWFFFTVILIISNNLAFLFLLSTTMVAGTVYEAFLCRKDLTAWFVLCDEEATATTGRLIFLFLTEINFWHDF